MPGLTVSSIIKFVKRRLGVPAVSLELDDSYIKDIILEEALPVFTQYSPDIGYTKIIKDSNEHKVDPNLETLFWVIDPQGRRVIHVVDVYQEFMSLIAGGYPYLNIPIVSYDQVDDLALKIMEAETRAMFSKADVTWEQSPTVNQIYIYGEASLNSSYVVKYTREHAEDLSTIPVHLEPTFKNLCLAYVMITVGNIRKKYSGIETPIGALNLSPEIYDEGNTLLDKVMEELKVQEPPITPIYIG